MLFSNLLNSIDERREKVWQRKESQKQMFRQELSQKTGYTAAASAEIRSK
jgi:hypothetical protein